MEKMLISVPDEVAIRFRTTVPSRQRSKVVVRLIEKEIEKREMALYQCALDVEKDEKLHEEMEDWNVTIKDGLDDEAW